MAEHVARCHKRDEDLERGTKAAENFEKAYKISESEKAKVLNKFRGGKPRVRRSDHARPSGARRGVPSSSSPGDEEEEDEEGEGDDDVDEEEGEEEEEDDEEEDESDGDLEEPNFERCAGACLSSLRQIMKASSTKLDHEIVSNLFDLIVWVFSDREQSYIE